MRHLLALFAALFLTLSLVPTTTAQNAPGAEGPADEQRYVEVIFTVDADSGETIRAHAKATLAALDLPYSEYASRLRYVYEHTINGYALLLTDWEADKAERLFGDGNAFGVQGMTASRAFANGTPFMEAVSEQQASVFAATEKVPEGVVRIAGTSPTATPNVDVAIIDTGTSKDHPDLNVVGGYDCIDPDIPYGVDGNGHGTHVGGTVGALLNGSGVVGVAPGANLYSVRVLDASGRGSTASVICGIDWVAGQADVIDVANMSLGGAIEQLLPCGGGDPLHDAVCILTERVPLVVAAGNSAEPITKVAPAAYPEVIAVSAMADYDGQGGGLALAPGAACTASTPDDQFASFSNYGDVAFAAPGVCVISTYVDSEGIYRYAWGSGTSMSSPHGTGCLARYLNDNPDQREQVAEAVVAWSQSRAGTALLGDRDAVAEPLLNCAGIPRAA